MKLPSGMMECNEPRILDSILQTTVMTGSFSCGQQGFNKDHVLKQLLSSSHLQAMLRRQHSASARSCWSINGLGSYKCDKCVTSSSAKYVEFAGNTDANNACWSYWGSLGWPKPLSIYIYIYIHYLYIYIHTYIINNLQIYVTYICKIYKLTTKWIKYSYSVQVCPVNAIKPYKKPCFRIWTAREAAMIAWKESADEDMNRNMCTHGRQLRVLLLFHPPLQPATASHFA